MHISVCDMHIVLHNPGGRSRAATRGQLSDAVRAERGRQAHAQCCGHTDRRKPHARFRERSEARIDHWASVNCLTRDRVSRPVTLRGLKSSTPQAPSASNLWPVSREERRAGGGGIETAKAVRGVAPPCPQYDLSPKGGGNSTSIVKRWHIWSWRRRVCGDT